MVSMNNETSFVYIPTHAFGSFVNSDCGIPFMSSSTCRLVSTSIILTDKGGRFGRGVNTQNTLHGLLGIPMECLTDGGLMALPITA